MKRLVLAAAFLCMPLFAHAQNVGEDDQRVHYFECYAKCSANRPYEYCQSLCSCATAEVAKLSKAEYDGYNAGMGKGGSDSAQGQSYVKKITALCHKNAHAMVK